LSGLCFFGKKPKKCSSLRFNSFSKNTSTLDMSKNSIICAFFAMFALFFYQCATIQVTETAKVAASSPFKKILFVEKVNDENTYDFYNKFRQSLKHQCAENGFEADFVRLTSKMDAPQQKLAAIQQKFQPDMIYTLETDNAKAYKWGPLNNAVRKINVTCTLVSFPAAVPIWNGNLYIEQTWGVDVATEKAAKALIIKSLKN
jgi:hypothetical protein